MQVLGTTGVPMVPQLQTSCRMWILKNCLHEHFLIGKGSSMIDMILLFAEYPALNGSGLATGVVNSYTGHFLSWAVCLSQNR